MVLNLFLIKITISRTASTIKTAYIISPKENGNHPKAYLKPFEITGYIPLLYHCSTACGYKASSRTTSICTNNSNPIMRVMRFFFKRYDLNSSQFTM